MLSTTVVFLHAHPDDEAIFTGGTMARLAAAGHRVVLAVATRGERGEAPPGVLALPSHRESETVEAAGLLGVARVEFLGWEDSGLDREAAGDRAFSRADVDEAAGRLASLLVEEAAGVIVGYDEHGIYGHPDHVQVHHVGHRAAGIAHVPTVYDATVDREYLHFVETHLVAEAVAGLGLVASPIGAPSVLVTTTVDVRRQLDTKRAAMAAHISQIPETASAMRLPTEAFAAVYGWEWYVRHGPAGPLDDLQ